MVKKQLESDVEFTHTIGMVAEVYQELSAMKMKKIRNLVLQSREFLSGLSDIFADVEYADRDRVLKLSKKKGENLPRFERDVLVLLSPNGGLWGEIVPSVLTFFAKRVDEKDNVDIVIIGKVGKVFFDKEYPTKGYTYFDLDNNVHSISQLGPILYSLQKYDNVYVFHGLFESLYVQNPVSSNVTGQPQERVAAPSARGSDTQFAFEPEIEEVVGFFSVQVFSSLFKQTVHEFQLASLASRTRAMDDVITNVEQMKHRLYLQGRKIKREMDNKALVGTVSRFSAISSTVS